MTKWYLQLEEEIELDEGGDFEDEELVMKSLSNPRLFELFVDKYQEVFLRTANRVLKNSEESEDVVQDTFVKIYFNAGKFKKRRGRNMVVCLLKPHQADSLGVAADDFDLPDRLTVGDSLFGDQDQFLEMAAYRKHHSAPHGQLFNKRLRNGFGGRGDDDAVEGCMLRPAFVTIPPLHVNV